MPKYKSLTIQEAETLWSVAPSCVLYRFKHWPSNNYVHLDNISGPKQSPSQFYNTYDNERWAETSMGTPSFLVEVE